MAGARKQVMVRMEESEFARLHEACFLTKKTQSQLVNESLEEYYKTHGFFVSEYQLGVAGGQVVLMKVERNEAHVLDATPMNGAPLEKIAEQYSIRLGQRVRVVVQRGDSR